MNPVYGGNAGAVWVSKTYELYIATGISGALQHMGGCSGSKWIVASKKDPEPHIVKDADLGVLVTDRYYNRKFGETFNREEDHGTEDHSL